MYRPILEWVVRTLLALGFLPTAETRTAIARMHYCLVTLPTLNCQACAVSCLTRGGHLLALTFYVRLANWWSVWDSNPCPAMLLWRFDLHSTARPVLAF